MIVEQALKSGTEPAILSDRYREQLQRFYRQELAHLDAVIRFNVNRRNKIEQELRDLEATN